MQSLSSLLNARDYLDHWLGEALTLETVTGKARLVGKPFLIDVFVHSGHDTENLGVIVNNCPVMVMITSPVLCVTIILHPSPSITSMLSVFLVSQGRAMKA